MGRASAFITKGDSVIIGRKGNISSPILMREPFWNVDTAFGLEPNEERLTVEYLYYFCEWFNFEKLNKAVTIPSLTKADLLKIDMPLPPINLQREFTDRVVLIDNLKVLLENVKQALDDLVKSQFVEMFGDVRSFTRLGDQCSMITKGTTPTTVGFQFQSEGINFVKIESIGDNGAIMPNKMAHIGEGCHASLSRLQLIAGDLLFSIAGAIGRSAIVTDAILPANTNQALAIIRLRLDAPLDRTYLRFALSSDAVRIASEKTKRGIAQVNLSLKDVSEFRLPLPPLALQQQFADFVARVDKLGFDCYREIVCCSVLFSSMSASLLCT